jgi:hypothetical protein
LLGRLLSLAGRYLDGSTAPGDGWHGFVTGNRCQLVVSKVGDRLTLDTLRARGVQAQFVQAELLFSFGVDRWQLKVDRGSGGRRSQRRLDTTTRLNAETSLN